ncbi:MAG: hypothetical protein VYE73_01995 [Acidobacteriota bacterium]|nr:hypothetical protein [Acidobacteriota bacterium]
MTTLVPLIAVPLISLLTKQADDGGEFYEYLAGTKERVVEA